MPHIPEYATNCGHLFYIITKNPKQREDLLKYLNNNGIKAVFHYLSLHKSEFYKFKHDGRELIYSDYYSDSLIRLPLFYELTQEQVEFIIKTIKKFVNTQND